MKTLLKSLRISLQKDPYTDKKKILNELMINVSTIDTFGEREGKTTILSEIKYFEGWLDIRIDLKFTEEHHYDPTYTYSTSIKITDFYLTVWNDDGEEVDHCISDDEINEAIKGIENK